MSLLKIPLILTFAYSFHFSGSPPYHPSNTIVKVKHVPKEVSISERILSPIGPLLKPCLWMESILEILFIVLCNFSDHSESQKPWFGHACGLHSSITQGYLIAWTFVVTAAFIRGMCYHALGDMFIFQIIIQQEHRLVMTGPYSVVRHPGYAAFLLLDAGVIITHLGNANLPFNYTGLTATLGHGYNMLFIMTSLFGLFSLVKRADLEEKLLEEEFGDEWIAYGDKVQAKFIPFIW